MGDEGWTVHVDGSLRYRGRVVVPQLTDLREEILSEISLSTRKCCPSFCDPNDPVLCNSHFALNVIILFWLFWYFTHLVRLHKPLYGQIVTLTFIQLRTHAAFHFGSIFLSSLSSFSHFLSCQTHPFEDNNSKDVWLSLKTLKRRVAM